MKTDLLKSIERVKAVLDSPLSEPSPKPVKRRLTMVKKDTNGDASGKDGKKVKKLKKAAPPAKVERETDENVVTVAELAEEAEIGAQAARVKLREANVTRPEGRWVWAVGSKALKQARQVLGLG